ncbi:MAG: DUF3082 domain-containing protein [Spirulinaceae cyanobacterium]
MSNSESPKEQKTASPWRCLVGAIISGGFGLALYALTSSIAETFAHKPLPSGNVTAMNIAVAVRTLVVGMSALGTGIFTLVSVGLIALMFQILWQQLRTTNN